MAAMNSKALKRSAALPLAIGIFATFGLSVGLGHALKAPDESALLSLGLYFAGMVILWTRLPLHAPNARFGMGNMATLTRGCVIITLAGLVLAPMAIMNQPWLPLGLAAAALALDGFDGRLARAEGLTSAFGAWFDQELDALFTLVLAALVWRSGQAGPWILAVGLYRYLFLTGRVLIPRLAAPLPHSGRRRFICAYAIGALIVSLIPQPHELLTVTAALSALILVTVSFALDIGWLLKRKGEF